MRLRWCYAMRWENMPARLSLLTLGGLRGGSTLGFDLCSTLLASLLTDPMQVAHPYQLALGARLAARSGG